jgi:hypothetical protein
VVGRIGHDCNCPGAEVSSAAIAAARLPLLVEADVSPGSSSRFLGDAFGAGHDPDQVRLIEIWVGHAGERRE